MSRIAQVLLERLQTSKLEAYRRASHELDMGTFELLLWSMTG